MINTKIFQRDNYQFNEFIAAALNYLREHEQIPVLQSQSAAKFDHNRVVTLTYFFDELLEEITRNKLEYKRDLANILTYGFIGNSRGGRNGLVLIPRRDTNLSDVLAKAKTGKYEQFASEIGLDLNQALPVKVVTHRKNGKRLVGIINKEQRRVMLYDFRSYTR